MKLRGSKFLFGSMICFATLAMFLSSCGRQVEHQFAGYTLTGSLVCTSTPPLKTDFTNHFRVVIGTNFYLLQLYDEDRALLSQATFDGQDIGRWWHTSETNSVDTAWVHAMDQDFNDGLPLSYQEEFLMFPMLWAAPNLLSNSLAQLSPAYASLDYLSGINPQTFPQGYKKADSFDGNKRLASRQFSSYVASAPKEQRSRYEVPIYAVEFSDYTNVAGVSLPVRYAIADKRNGVFLTKRYSIDIETVSFDRLSSENIYPDVFSQKYFLMDRRLGKNYFLVNQPWPSRNSQFYLQKSPPAGRASILQVCLLALFLGLPVLLLFWMTKINKDLN